MIYVHVLAHGYLGVEGMLTILCGRWVCALLCQLYIFSDRF